MRLSALHRKLLRDLWHLRGQVLATALLVACGVAVFVMSQGVLRSLQESRDAYYDRYRFAEVFARVKRAPSGLQAHIAAIPGVKRVQTRIVRFVTLDLPGVAEPATGQVVSVPATHRPVLNDLVLREGRWLEPNRPDEVLVSEAFATANRFAPGDSFHAVINGHKRRLDIVGIALSPEFVYSLGPGFLVPDDRRFGVIWMSHSALEAAFDLDGAFNDVTLTLLRDASKAEVIDRLDALLARYGGVGAYGREEQQSHAFLDGELEELRVIGRMIPPIFLAVAAFLLHVLANRLIDTEREQIGLLKAFGYSNLAVGWHYLKMILVMVGIGLLLGSGVGIWLGRLMTELYTEFFRLPFLYFRLDPAVFVTVAAISLLAGGVGGLGAVRRAIRLAPATAMLPAPPVRYRHGLIERLAAVRRLSQPGRMILRHILRWPVRAALTSLGLAMSVALLVSTLFFFDAVEAMVETFFFHSHRQDITVGLVEPADPVVVQELARLPGVLAAEGSRSLSVRIRHGHLAERTAINGLSSKARLSRVLDADLKTVVPARFGLMLTTQLAKNLGARPGQRVIVEVLEGKRPVVEVPVVAIVQDYIGTFAYMETGALDRLTREAPRVSAVHLQVDPLQGPSLYARLKEMPTVTAVVLWRVALQSFRDTMAETMYIVIGFYVAFGSIIAFGVAYNSARIALSERGRELASLRVLGFTRFEVSYILLGELAVLLLLALPLGCLIGYGLADVLVRNLSRDLFRIPLVIEPSTYAMACCATIFATLVSGLLVRRRIDRLDLVAVLKTRE